MFTLQDLMNDPRIVIGIAIAATLLNIILFFAFSSRGKGAVREDGVRKKTKELTAEALVHELLQERRWRMRSFEAIGDFIGGYQDDELRQILVRAGAVRFESGDGVEMWGLLERNRRHAVPRRRNRREKLEENIE